MKEILVIGSGISGMTAAVSCAERGMHVTLVSPEMSERSQSVMAQGGINAALDHMHDGDSVSKHVEDTLKGGCMLAGENAVRELCEHAPAIIEWLTRIGTVFSLNEDGETDQRAFGGQSCRRTCYAGASTGKQIVSALVMETRRYEAKGQIRRLIRYQFHSGLIAGGTCYGALMYNCLTGGLEPFYADAVIAATGGQNALFGKTTGSQLCDGYAAGRLFMQGAVLKNLEFVQFHPTTIETSQKRMLVSEAARGEGGRLYYEEDGRRVYFMEDMYGSRGNLMPRDVVSRCMYETHRDIFLDVSFLGDDIIDRRLPEVRDICMKYRGIDIHRESIPVAPSVHFFMGGLAADSDHETSIRRLYAVGECCSRYHGANRLGGNSLLAALHSGMAAAQAISRAESVPASEHSGSSYASSLSAGAPDSSRPGETPDFSGYIAEQKADLDKQMKSESVFPVMYIRNLAAEIMNEHMNIVRDEESLDRGIRAMSRYIEAAQKLNYDNSVSCYDNYSLIAVLTLGKAAMTAAKERRESRGAHYRSDHPEADDRYRGATLITYNNGNIEVGFDTEGRYES